MPKEKVVIINKNNKTYLTNLKQKEVVFGELKDAILFDDWYEVNGVMEYVSKDKSLIIGAELVLIDDKGEIHGSSN
jgi:hypothetical protein